MLELRVALFPRAGTAEDSAVLDDEVLQISAQRAAAAIPVLPGSESFMTGILPMRPRLRLDPHSYKKFCRQVVARDNWSAKSVAQETICMFITNNYAVSRARGDSNLITLCPGCHAQLHGSRSENYRPRE
jgi:hypothetical protein